VRHIADFKEIKDASRIRRVQERLDEFANEVEMLSQQWSTDRDSSSWNEAVKSAADAYRELQEKLWGLWGGPLG